MTGFLVDSRHYITFDLCNLLNCPLFVNNSNRFFLGGWGGGGVDSRHYNNYSMFLILKLTLYSARVRLTTTCFFPICSSSVGISSYAKYKRYSGYIKKGTFSLYMTTTTSRHVHVDKRISHFLLYT